MRVEVRDRNLEEVTLKFRKDDLHSVCGLLNRIAHGLPYYEDSYASEQAREVSKEFRKAINRILYA